MEGLGENPCGNSVCAFDAEQLTLFQSLKQTISPYEMEGLEDELERKGVDLDMIEACYRICPFLRAQVASTLTPGQQENIATVREIGENRPPAAFVDTF